MSQTKVKPARQHSNAIEKAMHEADEHQVKGSDAEPIPPADNGGHAHSAAAHLEGGKPDTKPAGNLRQGSHPEALREPPTVVQKAGKQHR